MPDEIKSSRRAIPAVLESIEQRDDGTYDIVITSEVPDRGGDVVEVDGWHLANYDKNPVVMWGHDYKSVPIGRSLSIAKSKPHKGLLANFEFRPAANDYDPIHPIKIAWDHKFLRTASVGFMPLEYEPLDKDSSPFFGPFRFIQQELLEWSIVPIPMHQDALRLALRDFSRGEASLDAVVDLFHEEFHLGFIDPEPYKMDIIIDGIKTAIPPHRTPKADKETAWDAGKEVGSCPAEKAPLRRMHGWVDGEGDPSKKGSYKFPHHQANGAVVWNGVKAAMAALNGARTAPNIPSGDRQGIWNHLARHYKQFDEEPPELKSVDSLDEVQQLGSSGIVDMRGSDGETQGDGLTPDEMNALKFTIANLQSYVEHRGG